MENNNKKNNSTPSELMLKDTFTKMEDEIDKYFSPEAGEEKPAPGVKENLSTPKAVESPVPRKKRSSDAVKKASSGSSTTTLRINLNFATRIKLMLLLENYRKKNGRSLTPGQFISELIEKKASEEGIDLTKGVF